jgi:hypothetical protein
MFHAAARQARLILLRLVDLNKSVADGQSGVVTAASKDWIELNWPRGLRSLSIVFN